MTTYHGELAREIQQACGENVNLCFQCKKCTAGCPVADRFDLTPHRLLRAVQFGQKDLVLRSKSIWLCAACEACTTRCPQGLSLPLIVDALRIKALKEGVKPAVRPVPIFYSAALRGIKVFGRMYEAGLMGELYLRLFFSGDLDRKQLVRDLPMAVKMLRMGKLKPLPPLSRSARHRKKKTGATDRQSVAYYPGCSLHGTAKEYDMSTRAVADKIGLDLIEPDGWVCCGTTPAHSTDHFLSTIMPMRTLKCVEQTGQSQVSVPCPSCFVRLRTAMRDVAADSDLKDRVFAKVKYTPSEELTVEHLLTTLTERVGIETTAAAVTRPLAGLKVVCYYGCVITRPPELTGASECEYPMGMDRLMQALGAETLDWSYKTECCGVSLQFSQLPLVMGLSRKVLDNAKEVGADAVVVACPLCQANLDMRQRQMGEQSGVLYNLPVIYFTQLMGLAFGLSPKSLGMDMLFVSPKPLLQAKGLWPTT
ncbi:MAG: 4Fe-4S dicluster domain-containing protein [Anaerolineae bacterium]|nr:4Fe-4S dicluster domain-containing protein [Anaerolineae bacterium]